MFVLTLIVARLQTERSSQIQTKPMWLRADRYSRLLRQETTSTQQ